MVTAAALVIVLLQLHASDTLKEDNETARSQTSLTSRPQLPPPLGLTITPDRIHHSQGGISRQDEDLLDLMVRIAETPEEWERIHRVLNLIGREKDAYETSENYERTYMKHETKDEKNVTENDSNPSDPNRSLYKIVSVASIESKTVTSSTTLAPPIITPSLVQQNDNHAFEPENIEDTDSGWPDFEEAIVKKVKKSHSVNENEILETNWLEDDWLDPNWNNYLTGDKNKHSTSALSKSVTTESYKSTMSNKTTSLETDSDIPRSRLYRDPKILEFRLTNTTGLQNHTIEHNTSEEVVNGSSSSSRGGRPVFVYHRVTTSPQERRGNGAFIAVSVVRQSPAEPPPITTRPPLTFWDQIRRIQNPLKDPSLPINQKKHPHWRQEAHRQHNRGRRHHHTPPLAHSHH